MALRTESICLVSKPANFMVLANFCRASDCSMPSLNLDVNSLAALSAMSASTLPMATLAAVNLPVRASTLASPALPMPLEISSDALLENLRPASLPAPPIDLPISSTTLDDSSFG